MFDNKKVLDDLAAEQVYPSDYKDIIDDIIKLTAYLDEENTAKVSESKPNVLESMQRLEVRIVTDNNLNVTKAIIDSAQENDAEDLAPKSLNEATQAYEAANQYIATHPRETKEIARLSKVAMFYAKRTLWMTGEVARLQKLKSDDFENIVIESEQRLQRIGSAIRYEDVRDRNLQEQAEILSFVAEKITQHARTCPVESDAVTQGLGDIK